jgi:hypothetical protein
VLTVFTSALHGHNVFCFCSGNLMSVGWVTDLCMMLPHMYLQKNSV